MLNKNTLKTEIKGMLNDLKDDANQAQAIEKFAAKLATAIDDYVKTATVTGTTTNGGTLLNGRLV